MKIAILVDSLRNKGGVERIVLEQAKYLNADIYAGRYNLNTTFAGFKKLKIKTLIPSTFPQKLGSLILRKKYATLKLKKYDFYIFHGGASLEAAKNHKPNIWYCHSPSRYLYDLYIEELKKHNLIIKPFFILITTILRTRDQNNVANIDTILVNSMNVQKRVQKYYKRKAKVLYPFVDLNAFKWLKQGDFYLSTARLDPIKRIDVLVRAFKQMPNKKLIIASSGTMEQKIRKMAQDHKNIKVLGWVSEKKLHQLYGTCIATLSVSYKEDFGLIPIESMACGKPCIATKEGGHKETIINKKTGLLITPKNIQEIIKAVNWVTPERAKQMRKECEKRARRYSLKEHMKRLRKLMDEAR